MQDINQFNDNKHDVYGNGRTLEQYIEDMRKEDEKRQNKIKNRLMGGAFVGFVAFLAFQAFKKDGAPIENPDPVQENKTEILVPPADSVVNKKDTLILR